jgi:Ankyrin repeats (many copies)
MKLFVANHDNNLKYKYTSLFDYNDRLLGGGVPVTVRDGFKLEDSTLHWACSFNSIEVAKVLLSYGIDVDGINMEGITPLHIAVKMLNVGMIKLLLSEGASPGILDNSGRAPIEHLPAVNETIEDLLKFPPTPTLTIRNTFIRAQSELGETNTGDAENTATSSNVLNHGTGPVDSSNTIDKNGTDVTASSNKSKTNRNTSKLSVRLGELKDVHKEIEDDAPRGNELPLLVLWPPAKRQIQSNSDPFILRSSEVIVIHLSCETADIYPILRQSGLLDVLEHFKMETTVLQPGRGVSNDDLVIPKIRLCVDCDLCPGRHRFEIEVTSDKVSVLASDPQGGLYGLYALTQLFQLHSELHQRYDGVVEFKTNRIAIVDWPDVMNRAVMWSFRKSAQTGFAVLRDMVDFMSKLRINVLYLIIDSEDENVAEHQNDLFQEKERGGSAEGGAAIGVNGKSSDGQESNDALSSHITALDEVCDAACVELVPTVTITSVKQRLSSTLLKKFNHAMICVVFAFDYASVRDELASATSQTDNGDDVSDDACNAACRAACESVLDTAAAIGFSAVTFTCSTWTLHVADPQVRHSYTTSLITFMHVDAHINDTHVHDEIALPWI